MQYLVYMVSCLSVISTGITTVCRSLITKSVQPWEVGKVFSVLGAFQVNLIKLIRQKGTNNCRGKI